MIGGGRAWGRTQALSIPGAEVNEDAVVVTSRSLVMIDGATGLTAGRMAAWSSDAQWFAHSLAALLAKRLDADVPVVVVLQACLEVLRREYVASGGADAGEADAGLGPSASILIMRVDGPVLEVYSLGDCLALVGSTDGDVEVVRDGAVAELDAAVIARLVVVRGELPLSGAKPLVKDLLVRNRLRRNRPGGYWIADLGAEGTSHALTRRFALSDVQDVAVMTDGYAAVLDVVGLVATPQELLGRLRREGPQPMADELRRVLGSDPECRAFPRLKLMDDASVITADVGGTPDRSGDPARSAGDQVSAQGQHPAAEEPPSKINSRRRAPGASMGTASLPALSRTFRQS